MSITSLRYGFPVQIGAFGVELKLDIRPMQQYCEALEA
jgi:hypothetical protein